MNAYVDNAPIFEEDTNSSKENVPPPLPVPYPKIYHIVVPKIIRYSNNSNLNIVFVGVVHAYESQFLTLPVSTCKQSYSFTIHFNSSETIMM